MHVLTFPGESLSSQGRFRSLPDIPSLSQDSQGSAGRSLAWPHPLLAGANRRFEAADIRYVVSGPDKQRLLLRYSKVAQRWLIFEQRRNVSGGTGRIPQPCATRSPLRQESDASSGISAVTPSPFPLLFPCHSLNLSSSFPSSLHSFYNLSCDYESRCAPFFPFLYFPCVFMLIFSSLLAPARPSSISASSAGAFERSPRPKTHILYTCSYDTGVLVMDAGLLVMYDLCGGCKRSHTG